ncbi:BCCT family transporter [Halodesulfovibrio marinisediminis]|uniref:Betaine/carnitine transporter, BCCT family n=1 Tax=Halodesulfovibrio marinisediminis DSM 17456 TaxID=1121457 RepID=A0A1N6DVQ4_9BACT|nr:BCCT family transporter [Halodesulfovibrio marinisediminis]SIN74866.1 betaine/carnitine transporter, BCCT family [Halodesulfovibrio marinisediminis DSM 17456]
MQKQQLDKFLLITSLSIVTAIVLGLTMFPEAGKAGANTLFSTFTMLFGTPVLLAVFAAVVFLTILGFSKYGNIRLGLGKPEYSTFSWVSMMICAGLGSATVYWAFTEWAYYFNAPPLGFQTNTTGAYEIGTAYNLFHWGISAWATYCIASLPVAYHFHVRKNKGLSLSAVCTAIRGDDKPMTPFWKAVCRVIDIIFIFTCFGGLSITLGVSVPMVSEIVCSVIGIPATFGVNLTIIIVISAVFSLSSYIGIAKGMAKISSMNTYFAIAFCLAVFLIGPTLFIAKSTVNGLGTMFQNFVKMSLWTDPVNNSGFPEGWTIFYWLYWITYTPFVGLFVTKISKGRTIRAVIMNMLLSGSAGCFFFFGIIGNFSQHANINGVVEVAKLISTGKGNFAIVQLLNTLPLSTIFIVVFAIISILFLATTLDSAAYTMAATVTPGLKTGEDPAPFHRLFWCIMLAAVPLAMMFIDAPLNTIKTCAIVTSIPLSFIIGYMVYGFVKWMGQDYAEKSAETIIAEGRK